MHSEDLETAALAVEIQQGDQHEYRTQEGIEKELDRGIHPPRPAPYADDQEHRDQHGLPENIKEDGVQGGKGADHAAFQNEESRQVLGDSVFDHLPGGNDDQDRREGGQYDQRQGYPVYPKVIMDIEGLDPHEFLAELHGPEAVVEA